MVLWAVGTWWPAWLGPALWATVAWLLWVLLRLLRRPGLRVVDLDQSLEMQDSLATLIASGAGRSMSPWLQRHVTARLQQMPAPRRRRVWWGAMRRALVLLPLVWLAIWLGPLWSLLPLGLSPSGGPSPEDQVATDQRDPTPGDATDDCFVLTVSMCCTDPVLLPVWAFVAEFLQCPCVELESTIGLPPDVDDDNNLKAGLGPGSRANFPCDDENFSGTFMVSPGDYAYQVRAGRICVGSSPAQSCLTDDDCEGVACVLATPDYTLHFTVESCELAACCVDETCIVTNKLDCLAQEGHFLGDGDQPVNTCVTGGCNLGSCCLVGQCRDDSAADTFAECEALGGVYQGGVTCDLDTCSA